MRTLILLAALACAGCGTTVNLATRENKVYGGVRNDLDVIEGLFEGTPDPNVHLGGVEVLFALFVVSLPALDLPFSLLADTLTSTDANSGCPLCRFLEETSGFEISERHSTGTGLSKNSFERLPPQGIHAFQATQNWHQSS